jgi:hypothetical protein
MTTVTGARYEKLIAGAKARSVTLQYVEMHHIVPRSEGGTDAPDNLVALTPREHFLAHWMLYRIYKTSAAARAFNLMVHDQNRRRSKDYAAAKQLFIDSMRGDGNISKRPEVRAKLRDNASRPFAGKKRPEHAELMRSKGFMHGENNPFFGRGHEQAGEKNHMARKVAGIHIFYGVGYWPTAASAAKDLGVSLQAVVQAVKKKHRSKGWRLEYLS